MWNSGKAASQDAGKRCSRKVHVALPDGPLDVGIEGLHRLDQLMEIIEPWLDMEPKRRR